MNTGLIPYALGPEDGEAFWGFGSLWTVKASAEQTGGRFALIEELAPGGVGTPLHRHAEDDETFYVLEGVITFYLEDDQPVTATAGSFVHVPGGAVHAFRVDSETARYLIITTPSTNASTAPPSGIRRSRETFRQRDRSIGRGSTPRRRSTTSRHSAPRRALRPRDGRLSPGRQAVEPQLRKATVIAADPPTGSRSAPRSPERHRP
jgi:quercetin dioxygenase-like cupin family protein